eukprot:PhF_6_TR20526/c4_g3_i2/m.29616
MSKQYGSVNDTTTAAPKVISSGSVSAGEGNTNHSNADGVVNSLLKCICCTPESLENIPETKIPEPSWAALIPGERRLCVPQKIDPKTFFANERTFLKWLSISVLIGLMSVTLLNFGTAGNAGAQVAGMILLPVALLFMLYSLAVFRLRVNRIYNREPMRYDDTRGPTVLVVVLICALLLTTVLTVQKTSQNTLWQQSASTGAMP